MNAYFTSGTLSILKSWGRYLSADPQNWSSLCTDKRMSGIREIVSGRALHFRVQDKEFSILFKPDYQVDFSEQCLTFQLETSRAYKATHYSAGVP